MTEFEQANIIKAPSCPHYIPRAFYDTMFLALGESAAGTIRCEKCMVRPVVIYGQFEKPGPKKKPRVTVDRATWLQRRAS